MPLIEPEPPPNPATGPLVASGADWWNNARLNWAGKSWTLYASGYLEAARILVRHVGQEHQDQDTLVYPVVFLYRQYLELTLKHLVVTTSALVGDPLEPGFGHSLLTPWNQLPSLLSKMESEMRDVVLSPEHRAEIEHLLAEFEALDRTSFGFRYPVDKKDNHPVPPHVTHLNLCQFADHMDRLAYLLHELTVAADYFGEYYRGHEEW